MAQRRLKVKKKIQKVEQMTKEKIGDNIYENQRMSLGDPTPRERVSDRRFGENEIKNIIKEIIYE